jgi:glycosyltransferase involved in cell wall biosynthesis
MTHCIFAHRQLAAVGDSGWDVSVLIPNGWFPPALWRLAPAWKCARHAHVPAGFRLDGIPVSDLRLRNVVPSRFNRPREFSDLVALALRGRLERAGIATGTDVLLAQFALPYGPAVRAVAQRLGLAYAVYLRGDDVWVWPHTRRDGVRAFSDTVRHASLVFAVSEAILHEAERIVGDRLTQGVVVANGIDLALFRPAAEADRRSERAAIGVVDDRRVVICVAAAIERKGWRELLSAFARLHDLPTALIAVTTGASEFDLPRLCAEVCPQTVLIHRHDVDARTLASLYRGADAFCLPSHGEGMSNAVLEALASGLPVITTPVGGHPEVIEPGVDGVLVPVRDVGTLAAALRDVLGDRDRAAVLGRGARARAEAIGTPTDNGARVAALLETMLAGEAFAPDLRRSSYAVATSH